MRRTQMYRGEVTGSAHPAFSAESPAALVHLCDDDAAARLNGQSHDLAYSQTDIAAITDFVKRNTTSTWHYLGTCKMAGPDRGGVVDASLNVYGTQKLKVGDLSIVPHNVGANTANTAMVNGEKCAAIVIEELAQMRGVEGGA